MPRIQLLATVILALVLALAIACDSDDNGDNGTPTDGATATASPSDSDAPDDGTNTPAPDKSPLDGNGNTDVPTGTGQPSTNDATPAAVGTPTVHIPDITAWQEENYPGVIFDQIDCVFNPATVIVACLGHGEFAPNPPLTGEDISCQSLLVNDEPVVIFCRSQNPLTSIYYEIQR